MRALSIRQPYAEEILRGIKTVEYRSRKTGIIGQRFYIYAASKIPEQADTAKRFKKLGQEVGGLPTGGLVGTAKFAKCVPCKSRGETRTQLPFFPLSLFAATDQLAASSLRSLPQGRCVGHRIGRAVNDKCAMAVPAVRSVTGIVTPIQLSQRRSAARTAAASHRARANADENKTRRRGPID